MKALVIIGAFLLAGHGMGTAESHFGWSVDIDVGLVVTGAP